MRFGQAYTEDFGLQQALFGRKKRVLLAPQVTYYVKSVPRPEPVQGRYVENPDVCKSCPRSREAAMSDEFALARLAAAEQGGGYDYHRRQLVAQHCDVRKPKPRRTAGATGRRTWRVTKSQILAFLSPSEC